jgi:hypothetical protein
MNEEENKIEEVAPIEEATDLVEETVSDCDCDPLTEVTE